MPDFDAMEQPGVTVWLAGFTTAPNLVDVVAHHVGTEASMLVLDLVSPRFAVERDCVLLPWACTTETLDQWLEQLEGDTRGVETAVNHLHLWDVFPIDELSPDGFARLGQVLVSGWRSALAEQVPDRAFEVVFSDGDDDYGPTVSIVPADLTPS